MTGFNLFVVFGILAYLASQVHSLECLAGEFGSKELCKSTTEVCTSFTYFGSTFQGCMETHSPEGLDNCKTVKSLDNSACCCDFDGCNTKGDCGLSVARKRVLQGGTPMPTTHALADAQFCAVPLRWNGQTTFPCDFGSEEHGWTFVNSTTVVPNLRGCVSASEYEPLDGRFLLQPDEKWCPLILNTNGAYDASTEDWGLCECSPCRINPIAVPSGIANSGLCDFGAKPTWSYVFANGTVVEGLSLCVRVRDLPPLGYLDMRVDLDALWCPGSLNGTSVYDLRETESAQSWGICECAQTNSPTIQGTPAPSVATPPPTPVFSANGEYCLIQGPSLGPVKSGKCNFGSNGEWNYFGVDQLLDEGLVGCVPVGDYPPRLEGDTRFISEDELWCPGPDGLTSEDIYDLSNRTSSMSWGVCACGNCRIREDIEQNGGEATGLCDFGGSEDDRWTYITADGDRISVTKCATIEELAPFNANLDELAPGTLWCPGRGGLDEEGNYDVSNEETRSLWGLCECMSTLPPVSFSEETDSPTLAPTTLAPTLKPTSSAPSHSPTSSPVATTMSPTTSPLPFETYCQITNTLPLATGVIGSVCGFGGGTWEYINSGGVSSGPMTGCVSVGQYRPLGSEGLDNSTLWCPGSNGGLTADNIYSVETSPDPFDWGMCRCENCQITIVQDEFVGLVQSGPCTFGPDRAWKYQHPDNMEETTALVGCVSIVDFPPIPYTSSSAASTYPPGTKWCPAEGGLSPSGTYSFLATESDPLQWGLCDCDETEPPTPATNSPVRAPTVFGQTLVPTTSPTHKPTTAFPTKKPTISPTSNSVAPTQTPTCCRVVDGGPVGSSTAQCDFGSRSTWRYSLFGSVTPGLTGCISIDELPPFNSTQLRDADKLWCPTKNPQGLVDGSTYEFDNVETRSNWGVCECPCAPSHSPTSMAPTLPDLQLDKLALFIQTDHSGSIRKANKRCLEQSNGQTRCWHMLADFVRNLVTNITEQLGGPSKIRLHLSAFSCLNGNPTTKIITDGLTSVNDWKSVEAALKKLRGLSDARMYGTCPSLGLSKIVTQAQKVPLDWPIAYFIVTDGQIQQADLSKFSNNVKKVKNLIARRGQESICASTIGYSNAGNLRKLLKTECIHPASDFIEVATAQYSSRVAYSVIQRTPSPVGGIIGVPDGDGDVPPWSDPNNPQSSPSEKVESTISTALVAGVSFVVAGLFLTGSIFFLVTKRGRRKHVPKPHRHPDEVLWIDNPAKPSASPPPPPLAEEFAVGFVQPRRRSRASSDITFIDLPPPPPLPSSTETRPDIPSPPHWRPDVELDLSVNSIGLSPHPSLINDDDEDDDELRSSSRASSASPAPRRSIFRGTGKPADWKTQLSPFSSSGVKTMRSSSVTGSMSPVRASPSATRFDEFRPKETHTRAALSPQRSAFGPPTTGARLQQQSPSLNVSELSDHSSISSRHPSLSPLRSSSARKNLDNEFDQQI